MSVMSLRVRNQDTQQHGVGLTDRGKLSLTQNVYYLVHVVAQNLFCSDLSLHQSVIILHLPDLRLQGAGRT